MGEGRNEHVNRSTARRAAPSAGQRSPTPRPSSTVLGAREGLARAPVLSASVAARSLNAPVVPRGPTGHERGRSGPFSNPQCLRPPLPRCHRSPGPVGLFFLSQGDPPILSAG